MGFSAFLLIVFLIIVVLEYLTGKIYVLKKSHFTNREDNPEEFWKSFSWHVVVAIIIAFSLLT